ncbi:hypothetical protein Glove_243g20 [Diversispora epigaea]|uniref:Uncharacterized protein n=1 Tax=Diversispora epigaea TaxID=1348612 RepID=A0A397I9H6_9GLOM|nr:hypothetical protein Glove_243g20 [Diversispora epigaea]
MVKAVNRLTSEVCGRGCRRFEGCYEHWRFKKRVPCKEYSSCKKFTATTSGTCKDHVGDFYVKQFYARQLGKNTTFSPAMDKKTCKITPKITTRKKNVIH